MYLPISPHISPYLPISRHRYAFIPSLRRELGRLLSGRVGAKYVVLSCCSEGLALTGYYLVSIAFGLFFQPAIVHAAEASLPREI